MSNISLAWIKTGQLLGHCCLTRATPRQERIANFGVEEEFCSLGLTGRDCGVISRRQVSLCPAFGGRKPRYTLQAGFRRQQPEEDAGGSEREDEEQEFTSLSVSDPQSPYSISAWTPPTPGACVWGGRDHSEGGCLSTGVLIRVPGQRGGGGKALLQGGRAEGFVLLQHPPSKAAHL